MLDLLYAAANNGTGRRAALAIPTFGKTGTTQENRDALFIGFAGDLVVGVWVGRDDNGSLGKVTGGTVPAQIWRDFMTSAIAVDGRRGPPLPVRSPARRAANGTTDWRARCRRNGAMRPSACASWRGTSAGLSTNPKDNWRKLMCAARLFNTFETTGA